MAAWVNKLSVTVHEEGYHISGLTSFGAKIRLACWDRLIDIGA